MARLADLKLKYRLFMQAYPYRRIDWRPGARLLKLLGETRIALITSAGFFAPGRPPFDPSIRGGDWSFREIPSTVEGQKLLIGQKSDAFDHSGIEADRNLALPIDRLREMAKAGEIGDVAPRHFSIMGSISAPGRLISMTAPEIVHKLQDDGVDAVFLTPV
jgi:D-proline reductase (dithiol) PrdB